MASVVVCLQWAAPSSVMAARPGLTFVSDSTWTADPDAGRVHVQVAVTATSHTVDQGIRRYYFQTMELDLPASTQGFAATAADGKAMPVAVMSNTVLGVVLNLTFEQRLYSGQRISFNLRFDLVDSGSSTARDLRIDRDLMSFPVAAFGSPGTPGSSVRVIFPPGFTVKEEWGGLTRKPDGPDEVVFANDSIPDATALNAWFTAARPVPASDFQVRVAAVGRLQVTLRYWSDDPAWADQIERTLQSGYPVLTDLIGLGAPASSAITIQESTSQSVVGFSGQYDQTSGQMEVSYFADPFVLLHEIAHLWFNSTLASDRWIDEGFASYYAEQAVLKMGLPDHAPQLADQLLPASLPLNDWVGTEAADSDTTAFLYGASIQTARQIAALAGLDGLKRVWGDIQVGTEPYQPTNGAAIDTQAGGGTDWRGLLDHLEQATGKSFESIWRQWVVDSSQFVDLVQRDQARADYSALAAGAATWSVPGDIRRAMDSWQFTQAEVLIAGARTVLEDSGQVASRAAVEDTSPPAALRAAFEGVSVAAASLEAQSELAALNSMAGARQAQAASQGAARAVGLLGTDPEADLAAAREAFSQGDVARARTLADSARAAWEGANGSGQVRILGAAAIAVALMLLLLAMLVSPRRAAVSGPSDPHRRPSPSN